MSAPTCRTRLERTDWKSLAPPLPFIFSPDWENIWLFCTAVLYIHLVKETPTWELPARKRRTAPHSMAQHGTVWHHAAPHRAAPRRTSRDSPNSWSNRREASVLLEIRTVEAETLKLSSEKGNLGRGPFKWIFSGRIKKMLRCATVAEEKRRLWDQDTSS